VRANRNLHGKTPLSPIAPVRSSVLPMQGTVEETQRRSAHLQRKAKRLGLTFSVLAPRLFLETE